MSRKVTRYLEKMVGFSIAGGALFWVLEAAMHVFVFYEGSFIEQLLFPMSHEVWMRLLVMCILLIFGVYAQVAINRHKSMEEKLEFAYKELNQIFNTAADGMRVVDRNFNVLKVNETFSDLSAVEKDKAVGKKCYEIFHGAKCHTPECPLTRISKGEKRIEYEVEKERIDGLKIHCIVTATPFFDANGKIMGIVEDFKDITEHKKTEGELERLNRELRESNERLKELALKDFHTGCYNHRYLAEAIEAEFFRARRYSQPLSVIMVDIDYFKSINDVYGHQFGDLVLKQMVEQLRHNVRLYDIVIRFGGEEFVIVSPGTTKATALILAQRILNEITLSSFGDEKQVVRLRLSGAVVSYPEDNVTKAMDLITLADHILGKAKEDGGDRIYSYSDVKETRPLSLAGRVGEHSVKFLKGRINKLTKRANQGLIEAIFAFAKTIELKDHCTGEHVERSVFYATEIAKALNLPKEEIERIREATRLHDLGKVGISEKILLKPSKLREEELEEIKKHPQIGVDIIRPIQSLHDIVPLILYHQERWDGKGYPDGLKGDEIPIGARIIALADVYQALISDRPYRKAYPRAKAMEVIREGSGTQFDPAIVEIFLQILQREENSV